ncbi:hypothetical protein [Psittacicella hinzii]|nr:hypothetical protein [Psittacicella hinzii]
MKSKKKLIKSYNEVISSLIITKLALDYEDREDIDEKLIVNIKSGKEEL